MYLKQGDLDKKLHHLCYQPLHSLCGMRQYVNKSTGDIPAGWGWPRFQFWLWPFLSVGLASYSACLSLCFLTGQMKIMEASSPQDNCENYAHKGIKCFSMVLAHRIKTNWALNHIHSVCFLSTCQQMKLSFKGNRCISHLTNFTRWTLTFREYLRKLQNTSIVAIIWYY